MLRDVPSFPGTAGYHDEVIGTLGNENDEQNEVDLFDDVFGSAPASPALGATDSAREDAALDRAPILDPSDIPRLRTRHVTEGYREGIAESKDKHIQAGFDEGYSLGAELGLKAGWILGVLEGIWRALATNRTVSLESQASNTASHTTTDVAKMREDAEAELKMQILVSKEYFGSDGIWLYDVPGQDAEEAQVTFKEVAAAHPVLKRWEVNVVATAISIGLSLPGHSTGATDGHVKVEEATT